MLFQRRLPLIVSQRVREPVSALAQAFRYLRRERFPALRPESAPLVPATLSLPMAAEPTVSIVIPIYGKCATTWACLESLAAVRTAVAFEVIVVDDKSPDQSVAALSRVSGLRLHQNAENLGFIRSCNAGAALARGRYLCLLNNDTRATDDWLDELVATFSEHRDVGMVGGRLLFPDGRLQEAGGSVFRDGSCSHFGRHRDPNRPEFGFVREVDYCSGACLMLPLELWRSLGGFDEHYLPAYYEDTDLAFRVRREGLRVLYQPLCRVVHYEGITHGRNVKQGVKRYQELNREKFRERWQGTLQRDQPTPGRRTALAADRRRRPELLVASRDVASFERWRALDRLGFKVSVCWGAEPSDPALARAGIEVLTAPYYASEVDVLVGVRGARIALLWCVFGPELALLHALIRTHAPHVKTLVSLGACAAWNDTGQLAQLRAADLVLVRSDAELAQLRAAAPELPALSESAGSEVLAQQLHAVLARR